MTKRISYQFQNGEVPKNLDAPGIPQVWGIAVSNLSDQWLHLGNGADFAAPDSRGTFRWNGDGTVRVAWEAPGGQGQPAGKAGQVANIVLTDEALPDNGGPIGTVPLAASDIILIAGTLAALPAAGTAGRLGWVTSEGRFYRDSGTAWVALEASFTRFVAGFRQQTVGQNFGVAVDQYGQAQNVALMETDDNMVWGPSTEMRESNLFPMPLNLFAGHFHDHFLGSALHPQWTTTAVGAGAITIPGAGGTQFGEIDLHSGGGAGDSVELSLANTSDHNDGGGSRHWITLFPVGLVNHIITFGYRDAAGTSFVRWRLTAAGVAGTYQCETAAGGAPTTVSSGIVNAGQRLTFGIDLKTVNQATFWATTGVGGLFVQAAQILATMPLAATALIPFVKIQENGGGDVVARVDQIYLRRNT